MVDESICRISWVVSTADVRHTLINQNEQMTIVSYMITKGQSIALSTWIKSIRLFISCCYSFLLRTVSNAALQTMVPHEHKAPHALHSYIGYLNGAQDDVE